LALDELGDKVSILEDTNVSIDYRRVASTLVEEHADELRGSAGNDGASPSAQEVANHLVQNRLDLISAPVDGVDYEVLARTIFEKYGEQLSGPQGLPGQDGTAVDLGQLAAELALNFRKEQTGPTGPQGPRGEPGEAPPIRPLAEAIVELKGNELLDQIASSASTLIEEPESLPPNISELLGRWVGGQLAEQADRLHLLSRLILFLPSS